ncbi:MAG: bifunctional serine/threonine-protein kinase/universal stress protein [Rhodoblastus sp.]
MGRDILQTGTYVDGFLVGEKLHVGGMASLWRVTRDDIDFPIILKTPLILDGDDATAIVGFEMEQMILPHLSGPHAPRCVAVGDFSRQPFIVMEYIEGVSLLPEFETAPVSIERVRDLGARVATAIDALHRQHVIHLDIKPSNIILRTTGEAALIDFGLSRHEQLPDLLAEEFRLPMGTGPYISPEQVRGLRSDPRSDIFSLGVLLYHLATGERPFGFPHSRRALRTRLWRDPVPPRAIRPEIPEWLQEIILRCLEPDPGKRHPTAAQLAFDLTHVDDVRVTERGRRMERDSLLTAWKRRWKTPFGQVAPAAQIAEQISAAPIVAVCVDLDANVALTTALRDTVSRILQAMPGARLACLNILRLNRIGINYALDSEGHNIHVNRLVELKEWARPLDRHDVRLTFHVLEAADVAGALADYARANRVDQIVIGARGSSAVRRFLGSVSSRVVAEAPCTVTVVRAPAQAGQGDDAEESADAEQT